MIQANGMDGFVRFDCLKYGYSEERIGFGHGKQADPYLQLYRCDSCKTIGSNWVQQGRKPVCGGCYNENIGCWSRKIRLPVPNAIPRPSSRYSTTPGSSGRIVAGSAGVMPGNQKEDETVMIALPRVSGSKEGMAA